MDQENVNGNVAPGVAPLGAGARAAAGGGALGSGSARPRLAAVTNDQILANLQRKQNMFSEMYKALQKAQEESIEIEQWQAKLKELDEAKAQATTYATQLQDALKRIVDLSAFKSKLEEKIGAFAKDLLERDKLILLKDKQIAGLSQELDSFRQAVSAERCFDGKYVLYNSLERQASEQRIRVLTYAHVTQTSGSPRSSRAESKGE